MLVTWIVAYVHLLALGVGLGAVWARGRAFLGTLDKDGVRRVLVADNWWGVAALLWLTTGLIRVLAGTDKVTAHYMGNWIFWTKMGLFVVLLLHELRPMLALIAWRRDVAAGRMPDTSRARRFARISLIEAGIVVAMVALATAMARGYGMIGAT